MSCWQLAKGKCQKEIITSDSFRMKFSQRKTSKLKITNQKYYLAPNEKNHIYCAFIPFIKHPIISPKAN
jgi:hypothetical protein